MKNSKLRRVLLLLASAVLLVSLSVGATLAYLTSETEVLNNTFTVGNIKITLDEAKVDLYGVPQKNEGTEDKPEYVATTREEADRVLENDYKLLPGHTYTKDPTVTVKANSEESYIRVMVSISHIAELSAIYCEGEEPFLPENFVEGWDPTLWECRQAASMNNTNVYEFRYTKTVNTLDGNDLVLEPLFTAIVVPQETDNDQIATLAGLNIDVVAYAIQADGFADAEAAWGAWE